MPDAASRCPAQGRASHPGPRLQVAECRRVSSTWGTETMLARRRARQKRDPLKERAGGLAHTQTNDVVVFVVLVRGGHGGGSRTLFSRL